MTLDENDVRALLDEAARIDDDGFTDRVMRALPPAGAVKPVAARVSRWPFVLVAAAAAAGTAGAYAMTGGGRPLARGVSEIFAAHGGAGHLAVLAAVAVALAAMLAMLGAGVAASD